MTDSPPRAHASEQATTRDHDLVAECVRRHVGQLQSAVHADPEGRAARARASLAELRRARPEDLTASPTVLPLTIGALDPELLGHRDQVRHAERAVHAAVVLYAVHQQSQSSPAHVEGLTLGAAAGRLARRADPAQVDPAVVRRFTAVVGAGSFEETVYHLRSFIGLLRGADPLIGLDYGALARDLLLLQRPAMAPSVLLEWTRDLHRPPRTTKPQTESTTPDPVTTGE